MSGEERPGLTPLELVRVALAEDVGLGDRTSEFTIRADARSRAVIVAKDELVVSGIEVAMAVFTEVDTGLELTAEVGDGDRVSVEQVVLSVEGRTRSILLGERVALNFLSRLSGIATLTARFVEALSGTGARVLDTRKTTPGWRTLEKAAVRHGGGTNHRFGLDDMVLIKDNHIAAAGGVVEAVRRAREANREGLEIEVEVWSLEQLARVLPEGVDRVLLDNMDIETMRRAVQLRDAGPEPRPRLEASGNVTLETVRGIADTGVDFVSVGALTHSAPTGDLSLRILDG